MYVLQAGSFRHILFVVCANFALKQELAVAWPSNRSRITFPYFSRSDGKSSSKLGQLTPHYVVSSSVADGRCVAWRWRRRRRWRRRARPEVPWWIAQSFSHQFIIEEILNSLVCEEGCGGLWRVVKSYEYGVAEPMRCYSYALVEATLARCQYLMTFYWISFDKSRGNGSHFWNIYVRYTDTDTESQIVDPDLRNQLHYRGAAHCIEEQGRGRPCGNAFRLHVAFNNVVKYIFTYLFSRRAFKKFI